MLKYFPKWQDQFAFLPVIFESFVVPYFLNIWLPLAIQLITQHIVAKVKSILLCKIVLEVDRSRWICE